MPQSSPALRFSRRDVLKGAAAAGIGALTGSLAHGYFYERFHIGLTRETLLVSGLPPGLAGLRIGYAVGPADLVEVLHKTRQPFNVNSIAQVGALAALEDDRES